MGLKKYKRCLSIIQNKDNHPKLDIQKAQQYIDNYLIKHHGNNRN